MWLHRCLKKEQSVIRAKIILEQRQESKRGVVGSIIYNRQNMEATVSIAG